MTKPRVSQKLSILLAVLLLPGLVISALPSGFSKPERSASAPVGDPSPRPAPKELAAAGVSAVEWQGLRQQMELAGYRFSWQELDGRWAYRAPNRTQGLGLAFDQAGLKAIAYDSSGARRGQVGLALRAYGDQIFPARVETGMLSAEGEQVSYRWSEQVTEWYRNSPQGLEHGLTLAGPPGSGRLRLEFALEGDLQPELEGGGQALAWVDAAGALLLRYDRLKVYDASGRRLASRLSLEGQRLAIEIEATGASYPLTVDPLLHSETNILHASDGQAFDFFGRSAAASGDVIVIGADGEDGGAGDPANASGAVYVFQRDKNRADGWGQVKILHAPDPQPQDRFGLAVAVAGDVMVVGAYQEAGGPGDPTPLSGAAYIFERNQGGPDNWGLVKTLRASDTQAGDEFGVSVGIAGDVAVIGAWHEDGGAGDLTNWGGAAYVFERSKGGADNWGQVQILRASDAEAGDLFGGSIAVWEDVIVVGAWDEDGSVAAPALDSGAVYVFERQLGGEDAWEEVKILRASDGQEGDRFGISTAVSGDVIVAGAFGEDGGPGGALLDSGAAYVFERDQGGTDNWGQTRLLRASDAEALDEFGVSVAVSGDVILVGAREEDGGVGNPMIESGAVYVFRRNQSVTGGWGQTEILRASDAQEHDNFGNAVALSGDVLVVGAHAESGGVGDPTTYSGAAYVFQSDPGGFWQQASVSRSATALDADWTGYSVAVSGDVLVVGAYGKDGAVADPPLMVGAAYVFQRSRGGADRWGKVTMLTASDAEENDWFGGKVAVAGDVIAVGAMGEDGGAADPVTDSGAVYLFGRNQGGGDNWGQIKILYASDAQANDWFGCELAMWGDVLAVGALYEDGGAGNPAVDSGAVYLFGRYQGGMDDWGLIKILRASDAQANDLFGISLALWGDVLVVGAQSEDGGAGDLNTNSGVAYVFQRQQGGAEAWGQVKMLRAADAQTYDYFGISTAVWGDVIAVGAWQEDGSAGSPAVDSGAVYLFRRDQGGVDAWGQIKILRASDAQAYDQFGHSLAIWGDVLVVGADQEDGGLGDPTWNSGAIYLFQRQWGGVGAWGQVRTLRASDAQAGDQFGYSLAMWGDVLAVGAPFEDGGVNDPHTDSGAAYLFELNPAYWPVFLPVVRRY